MENSDVVTREFDIIDFTDVEVSHAFRVEITRSDTYSVAVTADEKSFDHIVAVKSGDTLKVGMKPHVSIHGSTTPEAKITMPVLKKLKLSGASKGTVKGFSSQEDFDLHLSGSSTLDIDIEAGKTTLKGSGASKLSGNMKLGDTSISLSGASRADIDIEAGKTTVEESGASKLSGNMKLGGASISLSGASRAELKGSANSVGLSAKGASRLDAGSFILNDSNVNLSGSSRATVNVSGNLDIDLSGASRLDYTGNPTMRDIKVSGAAKINST